MVILAEKNLYSFISNQTVEGYQSEIWKGIVEMEVICSGNM